MSNLSKYIEKVKEYKNQNPGISEEKLIRYENFLLIWNSFSQIEEPKKRYMLIAKVKRI